MVSVKSEEETVDEVIREFEARARARGVFESFWDDIAELVEPNFRNVFRLENANTPGERKTDRQLDSTPTIALSRFTSIMDSILTPRNQVWHTLKPDNEELLRDREIALYFQKVNERLFALRYAPSANFASQNNLVFRGLGAFGTAALFIDRLTMGRGLRYRYIHAGLMYVKENHQGVVDDIIRRDTMTATQLTQVPNWREKLPKTVLDAAADVQNRNKGFTVLHLVRPRQSVDYDALDETALPYESVYVLKDTRTILETGGYRSFPYAFSRYDQAPGEVYGRSPAMQCWSAIKTLMVEKRIILEQGHRAARPVLLVSDDGVASNVTLRPGSSVVGGVNADGRALVQALPAGDPVIAREMFQEERDIINDAFLVSLFSMLQENPRMTATEVIERSRQQALLLAPTTGRQHSEYLGPLIDREYTLATALGLLPPIPEALAGEEYKVTYNNPLFQTAMQDQSAGIGRTLNTIIPLIQVTGDPTALDAIDTDEAFRVVAAAQGVPASIMRSAEDVAAIRQQRADAQEAAQAQQNAPALLQGVAAAKKAGVQPEDLGE